MPDQKQIDDDTETRTKALTILARILAASLVRNNNRSHISKSENAPDSNNMAGDGR